MTLSTRREEEFWDASLLWEKIIIVEWYFSPKRSINDIRRQLQKHEWSFKDFSPTFVYEIQILLLFQKE